VIINYFSRDNEGVLRYKDFKQIVLPCSNTKILKTFSLFLTQDRVRKRISNKSKLNVKRLISSRLRSQNLDEIIEKEITRLFEFEVAFQREIETQKFALENRKDYSCIKAFNFLDEWKYNYLDHK
jgi:hypothetical protein